MDAKQDVKTAGRTLDVFETFYRAKRPVGLSELAALISAPVSSCHGLVRTLRNRGYLYSAGARQALYPTKRLLDVASVIAAHDPILDQISPLLMQLRDESRETVILGKRQDNAIVYLDVVEGPQTIRYAAQPGRLTPLHSSAIGKAMLGRLDKGALQALLKTLPLPQRTANTIVDPTTLAAEISECSKDGIFVTRGENVEDVMALASTVPLGSDWLGIAIAGPLPRLSAHFDEYAAMLKTTCKRATRDFLSS